MGERAGWMRDASVFLRVYLVWYAVGAGMVGAAAKDVPRLLQAIASLLLALFLLLNDRLPRRSPDAAPAGEVGP